MSLGRVGLFVLFSEVHIVKGRLVSSVINIILLQVDFSTRHNGRRHVPGYVFSLLVNVLFGDGLNFLLDFLIILIRFLLVPN